MDPSGVFNVSGLQKSFGATRALTAGDLELHPGEVHALMGENGSGKSTLVKILTGVHRPDSGHMSIAGKQVAFPRSPREALARGVAAAFQETLVVPGQTVLENVWLGSDGLFRRHVPDPSKRDRAKEVLFDLLNEHLDLGTPVEDLPLSIRQACCVARSLLREPYLLILDEATSALDIATRDRLFHLISQQKLRSLFISHRMDEVETIADRVTVMRSGATVGTFVRDEASRDELVQLMIGGIQLAPKFVTEERPLPGPEVLVSQALRLQAGGEPVNFRLTEGEIVGLAGLEGHGQDAFLMALAGYFRAEGAVWVFDGQERNHIGSPSDAAKAGIAYLPRERRGQSLLETRSILQNFSISTVADDRRGGLVSDKSALARLAPYIERMRIKLGSPEDNIRTLSGGNQQKVLMARWLATNPKILLLHDPTRGVDMGAKRDLYRLLAELAADGMSIVMLSTEVDEHVELMNRVLVFREGTLAAELSGKDLNRHEIVSAYFGRRREDAT